MIVKHIKAHVTTDEVEHRVLVSMTTLEAELWLRRQPLVTAEARRRIAAALSGCDQRAGTR